MKKILSFALVAMMIIAVMVLPTSAATKNAAVTIQYTATAPTLDGVVKTGEYGLKVHSTYDSDEFINEFDKTKPIDADFYMTWTNDSLYMAWVVKADAHYPIDPTVSHSATTTAGSTADLGYMWEYSCVQFMLSTGAPDASKQGTYQTSQWAGNYMEVGLSIMPDGSSYKVAWSKPVGGENLTTDDWDFSGIRDDAAKTTTYEVRIPWTKSGMTAVGNDVKFGFTYAVSDQQDFNVEPSMCEWQDAILGSKNMDNGAVITLAGMGNNESSIVLPSEAPLQPGNFTVPATGTALTLDKINAALSDTVLSTVVTKMDLINQYNLKNSFNALLRPVDGKDGTYKVVSTELTTGKVPAFADKKAGDIIIAYAATSPVYSAASLLKANDEVVFQGYDLAAGELANTDPICYATTKLSPADTSSTTSEVSKDESSKATSSTTSSKPAANSSKATSSEAPANDGFPTWAIIAIVAAIVVIGGGAYYFFVIKKKQAK